MLVKVTEYEDAILTGLVSLLEGKAEKASREVPKWLPSGEETKTVEQAAILMGVSEDIAARYIVEQKDMLSADLVEDASTYK